MWTPSETSVTAYAYRPEPNSNKTCGEPSGRSSHWDTDGEPVRINDLDEALMVDNEWEDRQQRKIANLIKRSGFRSDASPTNIDYKAQRKLDKTLVQRLLSLHFVKNAENIILTGSTGTGKS